MSVLRLAAGLCLASAALWCGPPADQIRINGEPLLDTDPAAFVELLNSRRPPLLSPALRAQILASLPTEGEVKRLSASDRSRLAWLNPVLSAHGREGVYVVKVFSADQMFIGLHARMVLLISDTALRLLKPAELQAVVAHEIGHEYVWDEYAAAKQRGTKIALQQLELYCDVVAAVTLRRIDADPTLFASAIQKMGSYNKIRFGAADNEDNYPSPEDRRQFDEAVTRWAARLH